MKNVTRKFKKSEMEDLAWTLWETYESGDDEIPEWGSGVFFDVRDDEERQKKEEERFQEVVDLVTKKYPIYRPVVEHVMNSITHWRECVVYDDRELSREVKDWGKRLFRGLDKVRDESKIVKLREEVKRTVEGLSKDVYFLGSSGDTRNIVKEFSERTGVSEDDSVQLLQTGHLLNFPDPEFRESREEMFRKELEEYHVQMK